MVKDRDNFRGRLLPEYFAQYGYKTLAVGKITHGYPDKIAFQQFGGRFAKSGPKPPNEKRFHYHLPDVPWTGTQTDWGEFPSSDDQMPDHQAASWAENELAKQHEKPFFMAVGFVRPHVPFYVPKKWFEPFPLDEIQLPSVRTNDLDDVPLIGRQIHEIPKYPSIEFLRENDDEQFRRCVQAYLACGHFVDRQVGRVLEALKKSRYAKNTVVVLFSDHGYHLGEKARVSKHSLWEESTRVPLCIVPAQTDPLAQTVKRKRCSRNVGLIDLYPTLVEMCELPTNDTNEGQSLVSLMKNPNADWRNATLTTYARGNHAVRTDRYRLISYQDGSKELYDHQSDPHEWTNLASEKKYASLIAELSEELPSVEAPYHKSTNPGPINAWFEKHLQSHGIKTRQATRVRTKK